MSLNLGFKIENREEPLTYSCGGGGRLGGLGSTHPDTTTGTHDTSRSSEYPPETGDTDYVLVYRFWVSGIVVCAYESGRGSVGMRVYTHR